VQIYNFITSEDMTVTKDLCGWCSCGYEQLMQACACGPHLWLQFHLLPEGA